MVPVDLRWGLTSEDTSDTGLGALEHCLLEIDHSRPFFVFLAGERYGWIPPSYRVSDRPGTTSTPFGACVCTSLWTIAVPCVPLVKPVAGVGGCCAVPDGCGASLLQALSGCSRFQTATPSLRWRFTTAFCGSRTPQCTRSCTSATRASFRPLRTQTTGGSSTLTMHRSRRYESGGTNSCTCVLFQIAGGAWCV